MTYTAAAAAKGAMIIGKDALGGTPTAPPSAR